MYSNRLVWLQVPLAEQTLGKINSNHNFFCTAVSALYCSHSMEPENGVLLRLATAEAYENGLDRPTLLGSLGLEDRYFLRDPVESLEKGLQGPSLLVATRGPLSWLP